MADEPSDEEEAAKRGQPKKEPKRRTREDLSHITSQDVLHKVGNVACARCGEPMKVFTTANSFRIEWAPVTSSATTSRVRSAPVSAALTKGS